MRKFPSIDSLQTVAKFAQKRGVTGPQKYVAKVKLHGTNAGIQIDPDGTITAMSRSRFITPEDDNYGFAQFVKDHAEGFSCLTRNNTWCIYGEWCGPGVQRSTACSQLPERTFFTFACLIGDKITHTPIHFDCARTIPLFNDGETFEIDFFGDNTETLNRINDHVKNIETCDPLIDEYFGISGPGEGLVFYPLDLPFEDFAFKAKGEAHRTVSSDVAAQMSAPEFANAIAFANGVLTEPRLTQATTEAGENIGYFLKWIAEDVRKECAPEIEASNLDIKHIMKAVQLTAKAWYRRKL